MLRTFSVTREIYMSDVRRRIYLSTFVRIAFLWRFHIAIAMLIRDVKVETTYLVPFRSDHPDGTPPVIKTNVSGCPFPIHLHWFTRPFVDGRLKSRTFPEAQ